MADYNRDEMRRQELRITSADPPKKTSETFEIDISDDLFLRVAKEAHARDITFNDMVLSIVKDGLRDAEYRFEHNSKPQFLAEE